jgi:hypothetical protein
MTAGVTGAGADRHRRSVKPRHDPVEVAGTVGAVGVGEHDQLALGDQHPDPHGEALAAVGTIRQHPDPAVGVATPQPR